MVFVRGNVNHVPFGSGTDDAEECNKLVTDLL